MSSLISYTSLTNLSEDTNFATQFNYFRKTKTCTDVIFVLEKPDGSEIEIFAHQLILAMRSPYFAELFYGNDRNNADPFKKIRLGRINLKAFEDMIRYCYGVKPGLLETEEACALFKVSKKFQVMSLVILCQECLLDIQIDHGNVFNMVEIAESMRDKSLKDKCNKILEEKTREIIISYDLRDVTPVMVHIILELPKLSLHSEYELIKWVLEWGFTMVKDKTTSLNCTNAREYLQKLLRDMNFLALTFEEFAMLCKDYPDFFSLEEIALVCLNIAHPGTREMPDWYDKELKIRQYTGSKK